MTNTERFLSLRKRVFDMIRKELAKDPYCKSYEGAIDVRCAYPNLRGCWFPCASITAASAMK
jgi:hypothetical protein